MPAGQSIRREPHDVRPLQSMRHVSSLHPPVQTSGHFVGGIVLPLGQPGGAVSGFGAAVSGMEESTAFASSPAGGASSSSTTLVSALLVEESVGG